MSFLSALLGDILFFSTLVGIGTFLAHRKGRSIAWGLLGLTIVGLVIIPFLKKQPDDETLKAPV